MYFFDDDSVSFNGSAIVMQAYGVSVGVYIDVED